MKNIPFIKKKSSFAKKETKEEKKEDNQISKDSSDAKDQKDFVKKPFLKKKQNISPKSEEHVDFPKISDPSLKKKEQKLEIKKKPFLKKKNVKSESSSIISNQPAFFEKISTLESSLQKEKTGLNPHGIVSEKKEQQIIQKDTKSQKIEDIEEEGKPVFGVKEEKKAEIVTTQKDNSPVIEMEPGFQEEKNVKSKSNDKMEIDELESGKRKENPCNFEDFVSKKKKIEDEFEVVFGPLAHQPLFKISSFSKNNKGDLSLEVPVIGDVSEKSLTIVVAPIQKIYLFPFFEKFSVSIYPVGAFYENLGVYPARDFPHCRKFRSSFFAHFFFRNSDERNRFVAQLEEKKGNNREIKNFQKFFLICLFS